jgi:glutamate-1-semialdehyde 2,1-aminomutase
MNKSSVPQSELMSIGINRSVEKSRLWFERAKRVLAGGISSSARATSTGAASHPIYITHGRGSRIYDADGNQFIDYLLGYGSLILGHSNQGINEFLNRQIEKGTMYGTCNTIEVQLAEQICGMVPCAQLVRFANSGSEAISGAVRVARAFTGKNKILKFEGHYHGWVDVLAVSNRPTIEKAGPLESPCSDPHSMGLPPGVVNDVVICPCNQPKILKSILDDHSSQIAAIIAEPIVANNACIMPAPGFLKFMREECIRRNIILIFDEIVTGFRVAPGGAQQLYGVDCDIAVYSKALGGGMPISAFAGKHFIMDMVYANRAKHGGTYNGSPICAAASLYTLQALKNGQLQKKIHDTGNLLIEAIRQSAKKYGIPCVVQGVGSMFQVIFTAGDTTLQHYRDLFTADTARYAVFRHSLLEHGIHINSSGLACWFVSAAHTKKDVELTVAAIDTAMKSVAEAGKNK